MDPWEDSRDDPLLGSVLEGRYRVIECVGIGGMGRVYRARQDSSVVGRDVAVKVLDTSSLQSDLLVRRFENEAKILAELRHPNTLKLIDSGRLEDGRLFIVTEFLRGETLDDVLERGPLPIRTAVEVLSQVCDSLAEAHALGIIHRDLKPGNIFLETVGEQTIVRVLDFGIAKLVHQPGLTAPLQIFGTPSYMSPEQASGKPTDNRADIYSLGVVAYECLVGLPPFVDQYPMSVIRKHVLEKPVPVREALSGRTTIDPDLASLVDRMLEKQPAARPQRVQDVRETLNRVQRRLTGGPALPDLATDLVLAPPEAVLEEARAALAATYVRKKAREPSRDTTPDLGEFADETPIAESIFAHEASEEGEQVSTVTTPMPHGADGVADVLELPSILTTRSEAAILDPVHLVPIEPSAAPASPSPAHEPGPAEVMRVLVGPSPARPIGQTPKPAPAPSAPAGEAAFAEVGLAQTKLSAPPAFGRVDRPPGAGSVESGELRARRGLRTHELMLLLAVLALLAVAAVMAKKAPAPQPTPEVVVRPLEAPKVQPKTATATAAPAGQSATTANLGGLPAAPLEADAGPRTIDTGDAGKRLTKLPVRPGQPGAPVRAASRDAGGPVPGREKVAPPPDFIDSE